MRVLLIHQAYASTAQAGGTRHHEFAQHLAGAGHEVVVIASPISYLTGTESRAESKIPGVEVVSSWTYSGRSTRFLSRIFNFLSFMVSSATSGVRRSSVDVVWGTSPPIFQALSAYVVSLVKRRPFLLEVRDLWPDFAIDVGVLKNPWLIRASRALERHLYRHAKAVIINSPGFRSHVLENGVDPTRLHLVPNGVDVSMFPTTERNDSLREELGWSDRFVVMYTGAHGLANDLGVLVEAAGLLRDHPDVLFVLLGDGKERPRLLQRAAELSLDNIRFLPAVPKNEIPGYLTAADLGVAILKPIPMFATTYPNKVFDYMAAGRPTLLAIDGVIRAVIEEADAGLFVPPGEPEELARGVLRYRDDEDFRARQGINARSHVEAHFSRSSQAKNLEAVLSQVIGGAT